MRSGSGPGHGGPLRPALEPEGATNVYRHSQPGTLNRLLLGAAVLVCLTMWAMADGPHLALVMAGVFGVLLALFHSLTVQVAPAEFTFWFGVGIIRRSFPLQDIRDARVVRNRWYYGWGVRLTPHGWLYNVSGLDAVEIELASGKRFRVGTDEPDALVRAIQQALAARDS